MSEIQHSSRAHARLNASSSHRWMIPEAMDEMIRWFCLLFGNQFTPDDVLDGYPVDRLMHDIALALMAVQTQTTSILSEFPTRAAQKTEEKQSEEIPLF